MAPTCKKIEIILQAGSAASKWMIRRKQHKVQVFVHVLVVPEQDTRIHFF